MQIIYTTNNLTSVAAVGECPPYLPVGKQTGNGANLPTVGVCQMERLTTK